MDMITALKTTLSATISLYDLPKEDLQKTYAPGKWTVQQILVHLADAESVLHERIKRIIASPGEVAWAFDQDKWCHALDYAHFPLSLSKALYTANRNSIIYLATQFYTSLGERQFVHSQTGLRTLQDEFDKVAKHNAGHIEQVKKAIL
jgi:hypothetical protein